MKLPRKWETGTFSFKKAGRQGKNTENYFKNCIFMKEIFLEKEYQSVLFMGGI
jgi:hypothetical protein